MQASATTENISAKPKRVVKAYGRHSHGPNFGKYVAGCAGCIEKCPDGPPASGYVGKKPRNRLSAEKLAIQTKTTIEQTQRELEQKAAELMNLLEAANMRAASAQEAASEKQDPLHQLVQLMMRREKKGLEKEEDIEKRAKAAREDMVRITKEQESKETRRQNKCGHVKDNGRSSVSGQVHNDGLYHPLCLRCGKQFEPYRLRPGQQIA